jgi:hypothetical protein
MSPKPLWPQGKRFAFTVFDDTDCSTVENVAPVYDFLADCGFRTTKSCWPVSGDPALGSWMGQTCDDHDYLRLVLRLQSLGFEIGWHGATWHSVLREKTAEALEQFAKVFGHFPYTAANHAEVDEAIYWGDHRLTGIYSSLYNLVTGFRNRNRFKGHVEDNPHFWGDLCKNNIRYFRNFVFQDINTLKACPFMPYHDLQRPYVNYWFASSNGNKVGSFIKCLAEPNQDRLEEEGGACIMYTHFANGFMEGGQLLPQFKQMMKRLAAKEGWFVPVYTLLDYLYEVQGAHTITNAERRSLERKWFLEKVLVGST